MLSKPYLLLSLLFFVFTSCNPSLNQLTDIDGNIFQTKEYQGRLWMAENLKVTKDRDGNEITFYYPNEDEETKDTHGLLYDYETACKVCPEGWKLPNNEEWEVFLSGLGEGSAIQLKENSYWPSDEATNSAGFSIRPAGYGNSGEHSNQFGKKSIIWSLTSDDEFAWTVVVETGNTEVRQAEQHPIYGFSVRCVRED